MSRIGKIARRSFLVGSAAVVGGVAFGYYAYKRPVANPLLADLAEGEAALTPYVKIDSTGITLITPRADSGQGAYHVQAALIAEELDVDLDQVRVEPAHQYLTFGIPKAGIIFDKFRPCGCHHKTRKQDANKGMPVFCHARHSWIYNSVHDGC